jgi:hypothetical protein
VAVISAIAAIIEDNRDKEDAEENSEDCFYNEHRGGGCE